MKIRGAVLETIGAPRPYARSLPISVSELELDDPGPGEVLIRVEAAGVCHSDLSVVNGDRVRPVPMLLGHEAAGIVEKVGADVHDITPGQRVVTVFLPRCEDCANCRTGGKLPCSVGSASNGVGLLPGGHSRIRRGEEIKHHLGVSGFATHAVLSRRSVVPVGEDVPPAVAAVLGCAVLTGGGAVLNAARPVEGQDILVVGLGGVGMAALLTAMAVSSSWPTPGRVIGVDANPGKLKAARQLGVLETYTPEEIEDLQIKAHAVVEAAGHPRAFETAVRATAPGGITVTVGLPAPGAMSAIEPLGMTAEARTIVGSYLGSAIPARDIPVYAQMWREGRLPVEKLASSVIQLEQINEAMDELADGNAVRQIVTFG
ncbi:alcohol dehydrogenase (plasmid) [Kocuria flava]|uniref:Alcohol dehydrogenase n=1 Tax=Kocuria flava TaxID=446860 RepID=A0A0U2WYM9_9MICC|nr:alcohol dehydrogenase catalytic domain-containing protein [Kocuria flava]ALU41348.1 alcohol dehydrogenase [Kocuria flava]GEO93191.1 alcohol dehydrogenase [Kocuria flava]